MNKNRKEKTEKKKQKRRGTNATTHHYSASAARFAVRSGTRRRRTRGGSTATAEESETAGSENRNPVRHAELQRGSWCAVHALSHARRFRLRRESQEGSGAQDDLDGAADRHQLSKQRRRFPGWLPRSRLLDMPSR